MAVTHAFVSVKSDSPDSTLVRPTNWNADHVVSGFATTPTGRLTYATATPVMVTSVTGAITTIYYTPYVGDTVPIYDGTSMVPTTFTELSAVSTDNTKSPAAIGASKVNDWFVWDDAGTLRLGHGPDWTSDTVRSAGTVLVMVNGIWLNSVTITNGPAASRGTYVGTTLSNASSQFEWLFGVGGAPPTAGFFSLWNAYNRVNVASFLGDTTVSWTYNSTTIHEIRDDTTAIFTYVCGLEEEPFTATVYSITSPGAAGFAIIGVGYDATNAFSGAVARATQASVAAMVSGRFSTTSLGVHFMADLEAINSATSITFIGLSGNLVSGMYFEGRF